MERDLRVEPAIESRERRAPISLGLEDGDIWTESGGSSVIGTDTSFTFLLVSLALGFPAFVVLDLGDEGSPAGIVRGEDRVDVAFGFVVKGVVDVVGGGNDSTGDFVPDKPDLI